MGQTGLMQVHPFSVRPGVIADQDAFPLIIYDIPSTAFFYFKCILSYEPFLKKLCMYLENIPTMTEAVIIIMVFLFGGAVKGALGFGLPLITMAILTNIFSVPTSLVINALVIPFANITQIMQARKIRETIWFFRYLLFGLVVGAPIGAFLVGVVNEAILQLVLGLFVILFSFLSIFKFKIKMVQRYLHSFGLGTGLIAGIVGSLSTTNGPILVLYLMSQGVERTLLVSSLGVFFMVSGLMVSGSFLAMDLVSLERLVLAAIALPSVLLGMVFGNAICVRVPARVFQTSIVALLCILGANLCLRALSNM